MPARPVHWHEGMFLRPHHFQAADRYFAHALAENVRAVQFHGWGLRVVRFDPDALAGFRLVVRELQARFRDGTIVTIPDDAPELTADLKTVFALGNRVDVFLAIPQWRVGHANLSSPEAPAGRYAVAAAPRDDENTGSNPQLVTTRSFNLRLLIGDEDQSGFEVLPLARLAKSERAEATPQVDTAYIPPVLDVAGWSPLGQGLLQQVYFRLQKKIEVLASQVTSRGISFDSHSQGDARRMHQLAVMNEAAAVLSQLGFVSGVHPFGAYAELCRLVGKLSIFGPEARPPELPRYDHDDLGGCFWKVKQYIDALLNEVDEPAYQERPFIGAGLRMQVALEPAWIEPAWQMFLGVRSNVPADECVRMLTRPERLGMKIGSSDRVDTIFTRGQEGLRFTPSSRPPRDLPSAPNLVYFEVSRESATGEWAYVQKSLSLAIRIQERDVVGSIQDQRELTIRTGGQTTTFTFTLYMVPAVR